MHRKCIDCGRELFGISLRCLGCQGKKPAVTEVN
jgi:hypothetical protein